MSHSLVGITAARRFEMKRFLRYTVCAFPGGFLLLVETNCLSDLVARQVEALEVVQLAQSFWNPSDQIVPAVKTSGIKPHGIVGLRSQEILKQKKISQRRIPKRLEHGILAPTPTHPSQSSRRSVIAPKLSGT